MKAFKATIDINDNLKWKDSVPYCLQQVNY